MKLYYPSDLYSGNYRNNVFPLLKPYLKNSNFTDAERQNIYGLSDSDFVLVEMLEEAQIVILPMSWSFYVYHKQLDKVFCFIQKAKRNGKLVWSCNSGDFGVKLPTIENSIIFRQGGYVSNNQKGNVAYPSFVDDYLTKNKLKDSYFNSEYQVKPKVGFCGQCNSSKTNAYKEKCKQFFRNIRSYTGFSHLEPQKILSSSYLRAVLLKHLEENNSVDSRFIKRKQYRAGVKKNKKTHSTTADFFTNILESQYVLCVRGAGNFSVRFYETLMMGRIPLYVHTDGYLPLKDDINWKEHVVWVDYKDRNRIDEILLDFHGKLNQQSLVALLKKNRTLWEEKLTLLGFFKSFAKINK